MAAVLERESALGLSEVPTRQSTPIVRQVRGGVQADKLVDLLSEWSYFQRPDTVAVNGSVVLYVGPVRATFPAHPNQAIVIESPAVGYGRWYASTLQPFIMTPQIVETRGNAIFLSRGAHDVAGVRFVTPAVLDASRYVIVPAAYHAWPEWVDVVADHGGGAAQSADVGGAGRTTAVGAFERLMGWLDLTSQEVEAVTAVSRRTYFYWKQSQATPRPNTVRQLWKVYALVESVVRRLGEDGARSWLRSAPEPPLDLLRDGNIDFFQRAVSSLLFSGERGTRSEPFALRPDRDNEPDLDGDSELVPVKRSRRVVRRSPITGDR
jgi:hypothetical protein